MKTEKKDVKTRLSYSSLVWVKIKGNYVRKSSIEVINRRFRQIRTAGTTFYLTEKHFDAVIQKLGFEIHNTQKEGQTTKH